MQGRATAPPARRTPIPADLTFPLAAQPPGPGNCSSLPPRAASRPAPEGPGQTGHRAVRGPPEGGGEGRGSTHLRPEGPQTQAPQSPELGGRGRASLPARRHHKPALARPQPGPNPAPHRPVTPRRSPQGRSSALATRHPRPPAPPPQPQPIRGAAARAPANRGARAVPRGGCIILLPPPPHPWPGLPRVLAAGALEPAPVSPEPRPTNPRRPGRRPPGARPRGQMWRLRAPREGAARAGASEAALGGGSPHGALSWATRTRPPEAGVPTRGRARCESRPVSSRVGRSPTVEHFSLLGLLVFLCFFVVFLERELKTISQIETFKMYHYFLILYFVTNFSFCTRRLKLERWPRSSQNLKVGKLLGSLGQFPLRS